MGRSYVLANLARETIFYFFDLLLNVRKYIPNAYSAFVTLISVSN